jgi:hypothetical protein
VNEESIARTGFAETEKIMIIIIIIIIIIFFSQEVQIIAINESEPLLSKQMLFCASPV